MTRLVLLRDEQVDALLAGVPKTKGDKQRTVQERLETCLAEWLGCSQSALEKIKLARINEKHGGLVVTTPEQYELARRDFDPDVNEMILFLARLAPLPESAVEALFASGGERLKDIKAEVGRARKKRAELAELLKSHGGTGD